MVDMVMAVDTVMVDTVDTTVERDPLKPNPKPKPPLLPNLKLMPMPLTTEVTVMVTPDTVMVDTDTVTITARDLLNPKPMDTTAVDTVMVDTAVDTVTDMAVDRVTTVELLLRIKSLEKFCLNNLAPTYPF